MRFIGPGIIPTSALLLKIYLESGIADAYPATRCLLKFARNHVRGNQDVDTPVTYLPPKDQRNHHTDYTMSQTIYLENWAAPSKIRLPFIPAHQKLRSRFLVTMITRNVVRRLRQAASSART